MSTRSFLNKTVLEYFYGRLKVIFAKKEDIPQNVSDLENDLNFAKTSDIPQVDSSLTDAGTNPVQGGVIKNYVDEVFRGVQGLDFQIVEKLPPVGQKGIIYLVSHEGVAPDVYDEYIWLENQFEKIGTTSIDLSDYMLKTDMVAITTEEIDEMVSGDE